MNKSNFTREDVLRYMPGLARFWPEEQNTVVDLTSDDTRTTGAGTRRKSADGKEKKVVRDPNVPPACVIMLNGLPGVGKLTTAKLLHEK